MNPQLDTADTVFIVAMLTLVTTTCSLLLGLIVIYVAKLVRRRINGPDWLPGEFIKRVRPLDRSYKRNWDYLTYSYGMLSRFTDKGDCIAAKDAAHFDTLLLDPYLGEAAEWYVKKYRVKL